MTPVHCSINKAYLACKVVILRAGRFWPQLGLLHYFLGPFDTTATSTVKYELWSQVGRQEETSLEQSRDNVVEISLPVKLFLVESQPLKFANL